MSPILAKYLSPEPKYEVFNDMRASTGERYVLIVLNQVQARPIVMSLMGDHGFPLDLAIEAETTAAVFRGMSAQARELFYGEFLVNLKNWQAQMMLGQQRSPFYVVWPPRLQRAVELFKSSHVPS